MGAEHVLHALIEHGAAWRVKVPPPCRSELQAFVEQELDRLPPANVYRDAAVPAMAKDLVDALRRSRWTIFEKPLTPKDIAARTAMIPRVRDWITWATADDLVVDEALGEAASLAAQRGHASVKPTHFLRVVADQHWLGAPRSLAEVLDELLDADASPHPAGSGAEPTVSEDLSVFVATTKVHARMAQRPATSDMVLSVALRDDAVRSILGAASVDVRALAQYLAHGTRTITSDPETGMVDVVFHDDDYTPLETVREMMERFFQTTPAEGKSKVAIAHEEGEVVIATLDASEARHRANQARLAAHDQRYPLRITLRST